MNEQRAGRMLRVCVFTGSRADYGPLVAVIRKLEEDSEIDLRVLATGSHLLKEKGMTVDDILADGFRVDERVDNVLASDSPSGVASSFGLGVVGYSQALARIRPDRFIVLGDRYEALAGAVAAALHHVPIAHICGGEVTAGSTDEWARHAISKIAQLHFVATDEFRRRVVQLGERPDRVFNVGSPGLDTIRTMNWMTRADLAADLGLELRTPLILVTYHPATADLAGSAAGAAGLAAALERFPEATVVITGTNVDLGSTSVVAPLVEHVQRNRGRAVLCDSLGQQRYLSLLKLADLAVGNSSSALIEAPAVRTPTVNIGSRQEGRPRAASVIDCGVTADEIEKAMCTALAAEHRGLTRSVTSPYGDGHAAERIITILKRVRIDNVAKSFFDLPTPRPDLAE
ncbi:UDP-N-acetylglucosamine 2-epimerase [Amycolatopsis pithecellobii]|uniref:UDP-N-acetylglucosamine 2-epimerase (Hydrolyzing) n=1 Tax=Amycolatopsis pithecellobii TaxID=664692 RepID=A0A6N7ZBD2_9PSEU|nr:UDP-N-acetylglucosamine 2-epimerase [Amycolatopsis pithecellobii]MTD58998.1 UDP-N-acetylglucosamine 2-epimerase (hydrolyzing) [Amycolatopsis pithecellobii]